jgi:hypothetical protein
MAGFTPGLVQDQLRRTPQVGTETALTRHRPPDGL